MKNPIYSLEFPYVQIIRLNETNPNLFVLLNTKTLNRTHPYGDWVAETDLTAEEIGQLLGN